MEGEGGTLLSYMLSMQVRSSTRKSEPNRNDAHERKGLRKGVAFGFSLFLSTPEKKERKKRRRLHVRYIVLAASQRS